MELAPINTIKTMDSREIAEITGKRHDHVVRDIEQQLSQLEGGILKFGDTYKHEQNGQEYKCYRLPYRETIILVSGYSIDLRAKVIDRWMELEAQQTPKTFAQALRLAADQAEIIEQQQRKIELDAPKVEAHDILMKTDTMMCITKACKHFGVHPRKEAIPYLIEKGYLTLGQLPTQKAIDSDVLALRENASKRTGKAYLQAVVKANQLEKFGKIIAKAVQK